MRNSRRLRTMTDYKKCWHRSAKGNNHTCTASKFFFFFFFFFFFDKHVQQILVHNKIYNFRTCQSLCCQCKPRVWVNAWPSMFWSLHIIRGLTLTCWLRENRKQWTSMLSCFLSSICVLDAADSITQSQSFSHSEDTTLASKIEAFYWDSLVQGSCLLGNMEQLYPS